MLPVARRHILIADDMRPNRQLIRRILEVACHTVTEVQDGTQAISQCRTQKFDLIFMGIEMPTLDGVMVTRMLRRQCIYKAATPVIAVTGHVVQNQLAEFHEAGIDECLAKPFFRILLLDLVNRWTEKECHGAVSLDQALHAPRLCSSLRQRLMWH